MRSVIWAAVPAALPVRVDELPLQYYLDQLLAVRRFNMLLLALFGVLALVIASAGIYGVVAYVVAQRTHEIGVRLALGARPGMILATALASALRYVGLGLAIGAVGAWNLAESVSGFLFQVEPHEPVVYAGTFAVLFCAAVIAAFRPAAQAAAVDPVIALRAE